MISRRITEQHSLDDGQQGEGLKIRFLQMPLASTVGINADLGTGEEIPTNSIDVWKQDEPAIRPPVYSTAGSKTFRTFSFS
jgi:hypothetical protein